ncbi:MAG: hypothetical protein JNL02_15040 [Saprospiraceae bacterium]|nr:hypothetical protein [Saprospiraceae bacterium]
MKGFVILLVAFLHFSQCQVYKKTFSKKGVYHYEATADQPSFFSITIKFYPDNTFLMFGVSQNPGNMVQPTFLRYLTYGEWGQKGDYLVLNTNLAKKKIIKEKYQKYLEIRPWDYSEALVKVENDSFLILKKPRQIYSLKRNIFLGLQ